MTETQIQRVIKETATALSFAFYHTRNSFGSDEGFPDIVVAGPIASAAPSVLFYETKGPRGKVTPKQELWLSLLQGAGCTARLIYEDDLPTVYADIEHAYQRHLDART